MILKENYPLQPGPSITMFSYQYLDFFQLEFCSDNSLDYDFDTHVARYADIFGLDEKGLKDDYHPIQMIPPASDGFGSSEVRTLVGVLRLLKTMLRQNYQTLKHRPHSTHLRKTLNGSGIS